MSAEQFAKSIADEIINGNSSYEMISFKMNEFVRCNLRNS